MTLAIEGDVAGVQWVLRVGTYAVERAPQVRGQAAFHFDVFDVALEPEKLRGRPSGDGGSAGRFAGVGL
jgi:hypothetical protein